jgi:hypothetical protein
MTLSVERTEMERPRRRDGSPRKSDRQKFHVDVIQLASDVVLQAMYNAARSCSCASEDISAAPSQYEMEKI